MVSLWAFILRRLDAVKEVCFKLTELFEPGVDYVFVNPEREPVAELGYDIAFVPWFFIELTEPEVCCCGLLVTSGYTNDCFEVITESCVLH